MNIVGMGMLSAAYFHPLVGAEGLRAIPLDLHAWFLTELLAEGAMRALFSLLFGAGILLFVTGARAKSVALHYERTFWLMMFGLIDAFVLLWNGDILVVYAVCGAILYLARNAGTSGLFAAVILLLVVMGALHWSINWAFTDSRVAATELWLDFAAESSPSAELVESELTQRRGSYLSAFIWNVPKALEQVFFALPTLLVWDALTMMLLGMALYKAGVLTGARSSTFYRRLMLAGLGFGVLINYWETTGIQATNYDALATFGFSQITYDLGRMSLALGYVGLLGWVVANDWLTGARRRLAAVGRMALTNYLMHSLIALFLFTGAGLALVGQLHRWQLYLIVLAIWVFQLWFSPWWLSRHAMGPVEALWRRLTYGRLFESRAS